MAGATMQYDLSTGGARVAEGLAAHTHRFAVTDRMVAWQIEGRIGQQPQGAQLDQRGGPAGQADRGGPCAGDGPGAVIGTNFP